MENEEIRNGSFRHWNTSFLSSFHMHFKTNIAIIELLDKFQILEIRGKSRMLEFVDLIRVTMINLIFS